MSDSNANPAFTRRWLAWRPGGRIIEDLARTEPTRSNRKADESAMPEVDLSSASERLMSWAEWKAGALNELFLELGTTGHPGRITADTIRHGEQARMKNWVASQKSARSE